VAAGGVRHEAVARYVVGCDGANSFVRGTLGATVTDLGFFFDWLIVDVLPHVPKVWCPLNVQVCDPLRPTTLVSGGPGRRRWEFMRLPGEDLDELHRAETAWRLLGPWEVTPENARLERHTVYRFQARWVDTWRRGRLLLAGDAAHQMPPFAGQGMCSGLRDAANLAWKLDLVLAGTARDCCSTPMRANASPHVRSISISRWHPGCLHRRCGRRRPRATAMAAEAAKGRRNAPPPPLAGCRTLADGCWAGRLGRDACTRGRGRALRRRGRTRLDPAVAMGVGAALDPGAFFESLGGLVRTSRQTPGARPRRRLRALVRRGRRGCRPAAAGLLRLRPASGSIRQRSRAPASRGRHSAADAQLPAAGAGNWRRRRRRCRSAMVAVVGFHDTLGGDESQAGAVGGREKRAEPAQRFGREARSASTSITAHRASACQRTTTRPRGGLRHCTRR
jgi:hypothetical protein